MKKIILIAMLILLTVCFNQSIVYAEDEGNSLGTENLFEFVPEDGQSIMDDIGVVTVDDSFELNLEDIFSSISDIIQDTYLKPLRNLALAFCIIVLTSFIASMSDENAKLCELGGVLSICVLYLPEIASLIIGAVSLIDAVNVFLLSSLPVYALLQIASGNPSVGASLSVSSVFTANIYTYIANNLVIPFLSIFLGFSVSSAFSHVNIKNICSVIYTFIKWVLVLVVTVFTSVISIQSALSQATDAVSTKTVKLIAVSAVPVVGKAFGEGVVAVQNSVKLLKSGAGAFGIIASVCIFLAPVIEILMWMASCQLCLIVADLFSYKKIAELSSVFMMVLKILLSILISLCIISIVIASITLFFQ